MKKLILIICLSFMRIVIPNAKYPYVSRHIPTESLVRKQCEENNPAKWGKKKAVEVALICKNLDTFFPTVITIMDRHISPRDKKRRKGSVDLLFAKRNWIREHVLTKENKKRIRNDIDVALELLHVSEYDKRKEEEYIETYLLMSAEFEPEDIDLSNKN